MGCEELNRNTGFGETLDATIVYSGLTFNGITWTVGPGENLRDVLNTLFITLANLEIRDLTAYVPEIVLDESVSLETTAAYLNSNYPTLVIGSTVHNGIDYKFVKMTAEKWEPLVMNLI